MQAHVASLLKTNGIKEHRLVTPEALPPKGRLYGFSYRGQKQVQLPPIKGRASYLVCLHEIGHCLGPWQYRTIAEEEAGAWKWARENHPNWGRQEDLTMWRGMLSYLNTALTAAHKGRRISLPPDGHYYWTCLPPHALATAKAILAEAK